MLYAGLLSITFRQLKTQEIVDLVQQAGLDSIEWGGDLHVPHGDLDTARQVAQMMADAGLTVSAYGSYYRLRREEPVPFEAVLATAVELGAPLLRVWAGDLGSDAISAADRSRIVAESQRIGELAAEAGVTVTYEFHGNTLTDNRRSAVQLLQAVNHPHVKVFWQPAQKTSVAERLADLEAVTPWVTNVHVFQWGPGGFQDRRALADGAAEWKRYINHLETLPGSRHLSLEYVRSDSPEQFLQDAATLKQWTSRD
ncbi:MAG: sugar phosphate isomerase/epimerase [Anaerolineae bacterium]|nr:sugar phosphate isomerase/epimerase [Anaerolineae bacterium]